MGGLLERPQGMKGKQKGHWMVLKNATQRDC